MLLVGLTGGICSGKSAVTCQLRQHGIPVLDCDEIYRDLCKPGHSCWNSVVNTFGREYILPNGELDRAALSELVFNDPATKRKLNRATHWFITRALLLKVAWHWMLGHKLLVIDMPLLLELRMQKYFSHTVAVYCTEATQVHRLMRRDACSQGAAEARIHAQMPGLQQVQLVKEMLDNRGGREALKHQR
ncbi:MAG: hypothetical protein WDW38_002719 [Sanguina aurantia]